MDELPLTVTVAIPTHMLERQYGINASGGRVGVLTGMRLGPVDIERIERACSIIDPNLKRNAFMRMASRRVADAICSHHDNYIKWLREHGQRIDPAIEAAMGRPTT